LKASAGAFLFPRPDLILGATPEDPPASREFTRTGATEISNEEISTQDPVLGRDDDERNRIKQYRKAVELAAAGKLGDSFEQLDKMGAVVACGLGDQAVKLAGEYLQITERSASVVVVSQTWTEVHRINSRVRDALKAKGLLGANDAPIQTLERLDLTNAQKRDERFYPKDAVIVFNQKVREAQAGATGKLGGIVKAGVLVEVNGRFVTVSNKMLDHINVCLPRELPLAAGDRLHLKANRKLASGGRATNGELVSVKSVRADGSIKLADGRVLDSSYREFLPGYAVTSYGSQGKTVDYVLFSDSTIRAATNTKQWYVSISRGRRGIRIFTPDKEQLRENVARSGDRPLAVDLVRLRERRAGFFQRIAARFGVTAARVMGRARRSRINRRLRERATQHIQQARKPSRSVRV
jgi:ATP-dependent exoDNAse (exonuclease V) alpha subunit